MALNVLLSDSNHETFPEDNPVRTILVELLDGRIEIG
jgi:hypothetical protein